MQNTPQIKLANALALSFTYAELHCGLLQRYLRGDLPAVPKMPPFTEEALTLDALANFVGDANYRSLRSALQAVSIAFEQTSSGRFRSVDECAARLEQACAQLKQARRWLAQFIEGEQNQQRHKKDWSNSSRPTAARRGSKPAGAKRLNLAGRM